MQLHQRQHHQRIFIFFWLISLQSFIFINDIVLVALADDVFHDIEFPPVVEFIVIVPVRVSLGDGK